MLLNAVKTLVPCHALIAGAVACALSLSVDAATGLTSAWRSQAITIDGAADEWPTSDVVEKGVSAAVANDDQFLYVMVSTNDPQLRPLMSTGLILWLDARGKKEQTFGVWLGGVEAPLLPGMTPDSSSRAASMGRSSRVLAEFDLLGPNKNQRRLIDVTPGLGIELATGTDDGSLTYEVKVPLTSTGERKYAVNAKGGASIGLGIATPDGPRERGRGRLVGSGGRIGGNPYYGGYNGGGFADFPDPDERVKPLAIWTTVKLAMGK